MMNRAMVVVAVVVVLHNRWQHWVALVLCSVLEQNKDGLLAVVKKVLSSHWPNIVLVEAAVGHRLLAQNT